MTDHPILFSGEMVKAILEGRKTMTRRVIKIQPPEGYTLWINPFPKRNSNKIFNWGTENDILPPFSCPFGVIGSRLWVKETWSSDCNGDYVYRTNYGTTEDDSFPPSMFKWRPSIFMPHRASRITLQITNIRAERVQDISHDDAIAEGVCEYCSECRNGTPYQPCEGCGAYNKAREAFIQVWDSINGKNPDKCWDANPWVWIVEFERVAP